MPKKRRPPKKLCSKDLANMVKIIQDNKANPIFKPSNRITNFEIEFEGNKYIVGYDKQRKNIITFLPKEASNGC